MKNQDRYLNINRTGGKYNESPDLRGGPGFLYRTFIEVGQSKAEVAPEILQHLLHVYGLCPIIYRTKGPTA